MLQECGKQDLNLHGIATTRPSTNEHDGASESQQTLTPTPFPVCTRVCTSEPEGANSEPIQAASLGTAPQAADADQGNKDEWVNQVDPLIQLAAELGKLSQEDRQRLAAMLAKQHSEGTAPRS